MFTDNCHLATRVPKAFDCYSINNSRNKASGSNKRNEVSVFFGCDMTCKLRVSITWRKFLVQVINSQTDGFVVVIINSMITRTCLNLTLPAAAFLQFALLWDIIFPLVTSCPSVVASFCFPEMIYSGFY